jgi:hypothetical protein
VPFNYIRLLSVKLTFNRKASHLPKGFELEEKGSGVSSECATCSLLHIAVGGLYKLNFVAVREGTESCTTTLSVYKVTYPLSLAPCLLFIIPCPPFSLSFVNCPLFLGHLVPCPLSIVHCLLSVVCCPLLHVSCPGFLSLVLVSCLLSLVPCPLSLVPCLLSLVYCPLSLVPFNLTYPTPLVGKVSHKGHPSCLSIYGYQFKP